jgi:hypothetical protein
MNHKIKYIIILSIILITLIPVTTSNAKAQKIPLYDEARGGLQGDETKKGFVIYNQNKKGKINIVVKLHKLDQSDAEFTVEMILADDNPDGGVSNTEHYGNEANDLGPIMTNTIGNGNSHFQLMADELIGLNTDFDVNYGHIDVEDYTGTLGVPLNYYAATPIEVSTRITR